MMHKVAGAVGFVLSLGTLLVLSYLLGYNDGTVDGTLSGYVLAKRPPRVTIEFVVGPLADGESLNWSIVPVRGWQPLLDLPSIPGSGATFGDGLRVKAGWLRAAYVDDPR